MDKIEPGKEISYTPECPTYAVLPPPGPTITLSSRDGFEDYDFNGNGIIGGVSGQFTFPIGAHTPGWACPFWEAAYPAARPIP